MTTTSTHNKVWYLRRLDLFLSLTDAEIEEVARLLDDHYIPAGAELLHDRQRERIYLVKSGTVRLYTSDRQQQATLALIGPGRLFGLSTTFGDTNPLIGATTLEPSYICFATWPKMLDLFSHYPEVMLRMTQALVEQIFVAETWVERSTAVSPRTRLASLLLEFYYEFSEPMEGGRRLRFRLTQADLARMINVSRETASRLMADFTRAGWISRAGGLVVVHNRDALENLARGDEPA